MPDFGAWQPEAWAALGAMITACVAALAALVGFVQLGEAKRLREEQSRPFVVVDLAGSIAWRNLINLEVSNPSRTVAKDVKFVFDPPLKSSDPKNTLHDSVLVREGIRTLPPGRRIYALFDRSHDRIKTELPLRYDVVVSFKDFRGVEQEPLRYTIDLEPLYGFDEVTEYGIHDVAKALREIEKLLNQKL